MTLKNRQILLIEPNYKNKYPPIGLMKLATYHRSLGDRVVFYKGELKDFVIANITKKLIEKFNEIDKNILWNQYEVEFRKFIKTGRSSIIIELDIDSIFDISITHWLKYFRDYYRKGSFKQLPEWDRIYITSLFTFHWKITIETINFSKCLVKDVKNLHVGGVLATVLAKEVEIETGIAPHEGLLDEAGIFDNNSIVIDELPLDYSILDEIDYYYPENNAFYGYMTRGCIRKCSFCAVWKIEPEFNQYLCLKNKIDETRKKHGDKRNLLLLDNNVLASPRFSDIIREIKECGFTVGAKFVEPNSLDIAIKNLENGFNEIAQIRKIYKLIRLFLNKAKGKKQQNLYDLLDKYQLLKLETLNKNNILKVYPEIKEYYELLRNKVPKLRYVDFNQGVDARLINEGNVKLLSEIPINPLRIAFDSLSYTTVYVNAIKLAAKHNIKRLSNYLLYNEKDKPYELYKRLEINILLSEELNISIYSFPMKFHPINGGKHLNRDYLGKHWNRKYIRAVQTVLNATKGKIGKGKSFFYRAFGSDLEEFEKILLMPEPYILFRAFFEDKGYTQTWWEEFNSFNNVIKADILIIIKLNKFNNIEEEYSDPSIVEFINKHYLVSRMDIISPESKLYIEKKEYDLLKDLKRN